MTAPKVDLWSLTAGPILVGRGEDGGIVALDVERISTDREYAMTSEGVVMLGRRAPLPLEREGRRVIRITPTARSTAPRSRPRSHVSAHLVADLEKLLRDGPPSADDLADAPILEGWDYAVAPDHLPRRHRDRAPDHPRRTAPRGRARSS